MRYIGLDLGSKTCGIALSDALGMMAHAYKTVVFESDDYDTALDLVEKEMADNQVDVVVLGYPKHMNGDVGIRGQISEQFKEALEEETGKKVILWDERLTTVASEKILIEGRVRRENRKKYIDQLAAVNILQGYLDSLKVRNEQ